VLITELRFDAPLCSILGNENFDAGHIKCSHGPQVTHPSVEPQAKMAFGKSSASHCTLILFPQADI